MIVSIIRFAQSQLLTYLRVRLLNGGPLDGVGAQVLQQVALMLVLGLKLGDLLRVQVLQELGIVALEQVDVCIDIGCGRPLITFLTFGLDCMYSFTSYELRCRYSSYTPKHNTYKF